MKFLLLTPILILSTAIAACTTAKPLYQADKSAEPYQPHYSYVQLTGSRIMRKVDLNNVDKYSLQPIDIITGEAIRTHMMRK